MYHSSSKTEELLGRLKDSHRLYSLCSQPEGTARIELTKIVSDLLQIDLSVAEHDLIIDVLIDLLKQAEIDLRRAVAERLSVMENIPLRMVLHLANDDIEVADPILRRSRVLTDMDLIYIIMAKGASHWRAIATRPVMSDRLLETLAETGDVETAIFLAENKNITLTPHAIKAFGQMAKENQRLAKPLIMRKEISEDFAMKLYDYVGAEIKTYIQQNFDAASHIVAEAEIDKIVYDLSASRHQEYTPSAQMTALAEDMMRRGSLTPNALVDNLRRGQMGQFIAMFSVYCALPISTVVEILKQERGQGLAVACKALNISKPDFVNIYLMTGRVRGGKIITQHVLSKALSYYDRIKSSDARSILNQSRH